ncbi:UNVERIFIED_CONTAM: hypothetical protein GTU68_014883 [Idotea baltica]|nr:hypothetical protein [Idotea baltica]
MESAELKKVIRTVARGEQVLPANLTDSLFKSLQKESNPLTEREIEVLQFVASGLSNKEVGSQLFISERTVKFHMSAVLSKLDAKNRLDAVRIANQKQYLSK